MERILLLVWVFSFPFFGVTGLNRMFVEWRPDNPWFQVTDKAVFVAANDKVTVICPNKAMYTSANKSWTTELGYENMHLVDARGYHTCNATNGTLVLLCDKPEPLQYVTLGSSRGPLGFEPGATYHFIGTSEGTFRSLKHKKSGHCQSRNLKLTIRVCERKSCNETSTKEIVANHVHGKPYKLCKDELCPTNHDCDTKNNKCVCKTFCQELNDTNHVCGSDGIEYQNTCQLERTACASSVPLKLVKRQPPCKVPDIEAVKETKKKVDKSVRFVIVSFMAVSLLGLALSFVLLCQKHSLYSSENTSSSNDVQERHQSRRETVP